MTVHAPTGIDGKAHEGGRTSWRLGSTSHPRQCRRRKYDECITLLKKAGAGNPSGRSYHAAFGPPDKLMVFDVWTSQAAFDKFGKTLMPILQQLGLDTGQPQVMPVHKVIVPAAKKASSGKKTRSKKTAVRRRKR